MFYVHLRLLQEKVLRKGEVCPVAFHENDGNHEHDENDKDNSDSYKQGIKSWSSENHGSHGNDKDHGNLGCKPRVPQTTGLEIPEFYAPTPTRKRFPRFTAYKCFKVFLTHTCLIAPTCCLPLLNTSPHHSDTLAFLIASFDTRVADFDSRVFSYLKSLDLSGTRLCSDQQSMNAMK